MDSNCLWSHRLTSCADPVVRAGWERHLAWLTAEIAEAERRLAAAVKESPAWRAKDERLRSLPGLGPISRLMLLAALPELGTIAGRQLAARLGLAPFHDDHGQRRAGRPIRGGRAAVRLVLSLAALPASRTNPTSRAFRPRLAARGKEAQVILTAVARKLLIMANAVIRTGRPRQPEFAMPH